MHKLISEALVCPSCKAPLHLSEDKQYLLCEENGLAYPIENGLPILLPERAINAKDIKSTSPTTAVHHG